MGNQSFVLYLKNEICLIYCAILVMLFWKENMIVINQCHHNGTIVATLRCTVNVGV